MMAFFEFVVCGSHFDFMSRKSEKSGVVVFLLQGWVWVYGFGVFMGPTFWLLNAKEHPVAAISLWTQLYIYQLSCHGHNS